MKKLIGFVVARIEAVIESFKALLGAGRQRSRIFDHLGRAYDRYQDRRGDRLAAGLTYYAFLSFFPLTALAFAVVGYVVVIYPHAGEYVTKAISDILPGMESQLPVNQIARAKEGAGIIGLVFLFWGGLGWVGALRDSMRVIWSSDAEDPNFFIKKLWDAVVLISLGLTLVLSVALSGFATSGTSFILNRLHLEHVTGASLVVRLLSVGVAVAADMVIFYVMFSRLSGTRASWKELLRGTLFGAVGLEILKLVGTYLIGHTTRNPIYASFAVTVGLLVWINFVSRLMLFAAAWTATRKVVLATDAPTEPLQAIPAEPERSPAARTERGQSPPQRPAETSEQPTDDRDRAAKRA